MRKTIDIPDEWLPVLRQAMVDAKEQSVEGLIRLLIWESPRVYAAWQKTGGKPLPELKKEWGGARRKKKTETEEEDKTTTEPLWGRPAEKIDEE